MRFRIILCSGLLFCMLATYAQPSTPKMKILIHLTQGAENPTVAALAMLVARTAIEEGHQVTIFLAGDAVTLMRDGTLDNVAGLGTGKVREHYDAIVKGGGKFYLSGMSSKARGLNDTDVAGKPVEFAPPTVLLKLAIESDKMFVY
jgi:predicted peroxiredoxin